MATEPITVLLTHLGIPTSHGTLYMLHHNPDERPVRTVGIDSDAETIYRFKVDAFHSVPRTDHPDFFPNLVRLCQEEGVQIVIPQKEVVAYAENAHLFEAAGIKVAVGPPEGVRRAHDKGLLLDTFRDLSLPCPDYHIVTSPAEVIPAAEALGYPDRPLIVRPAESWGARGMYLLSPNPLDPETFFTGDGRYPHVSLSDLAEVAAAHPSMPRLVLTEYLPGAEYSVDAFRGAHAHLAIPRSRDHIRGGVAHSTTLDYRVDLTDYTLQAATALDLRYLYGMQYKLDASGTPKILECNPRVQGTTIASYFSGINLVWLAIQEALGNPPAQPPQPLHRATYTRSWAGTAFGHDWHIKT